MAADEEGRDWEVWQGEPQPPIFTLKRECDAFNADVRALPPRHLLWYFYILVAAARRVQRAVAQEVRRRRGIQRTMIGCGSEQFYYYPLPSRPLYICFNL